MLRTVLKILGATILWCVVLSVLWVLVLAVVPPPVTWIMAAQAGEQKTFAREWKSLDRISRSMPLAVIASEDQKFFDHFGFDMEAIEKALAYNERKKGRKTRGASTISQQVAKNVFLWHGRTKVRKAVEVWFTLLIELLWSKERILEVYLNVAEMGKGVFGVEAASQACFNRSASKLTQAQAAAIAVTLPSPRKWSCSRPGPKTRARQAWVVRNMNNLGDLMDPAVRARYRQEAERKEQKRRERAQRRKDT